MSPGNPGLCSNDVVLADVVEMTAFAALPRSPIVNKSWLDVQICFTFIAEPKDAVFLLVSRPNITAVRAFPCTFFWAKVHIGAPTSRAVRPPLYPFVHTIVPVDLSIVKTFKRYLIITVFAFYKLPKSTDLIL